MTRRAAAARFGKGGAEAGIAGSANGKAAELIDATLQNQTRREADPQTPRRHVERRGVAVVTPAGARVPEAVHPPPASRGHPGRTASPALTDSQAPQRVRSRGREPGHACPQGPRCWRTGAGRRRAETTSPHGSAEGNGVSTSSSRRRGGDGHVPPATKGAACRARPGRQGKRAAGCGAWRRGARRPRGAGRGAGGPTIASFRRTARATLRPWAGGRRATPTWRPEQEWGHVRKESCKSAPSAGQGPDPNAGTRDEPCPRAVGLTPELGSGLGRGFGPGRPGEDTGQEDPGAEARQGWNLGDGGVLGAARHSTGCEGQQVTGCLGWSRTRGRGRGREGRHGDPSMAGCGEGRLTVSRQAGQGPLGLRPAVLQLHLDGVLVAGYLACGGGQGAETKHRAPSLRTQAPAGPDGRLPSTSSSFFDRTCSS